VARTLNPNFNMWKASEPVVGHWIRQNLGPARIVGDVRNGLHAAYRLAEQLPELAARSEKLAAEVGAMAEHGLRFDAETSEAFGRSEARHSRSGRIALWIIAFCAVALVWRLW
jgi:ubiquinone biosynthesis protein